MDTKHAEHLVDLVDEHGSVVGQKLRKDIDKSADLYQSVYVMLITPHRQLVLATVPDRSDLPNLYAGRLGATVAAIKRHGETSIAAAQRALSEEIGVVGQLPKHLGDQFVAFPDGRRVYLSSYYMVHEQPTLFSATDIRELTAVAAEEIETRIADQQNMLTPTLQVIWRSYREQLPV